MDTVISDQRPSIKNNRRGLAKRVCRKINANSSSSATESDTAESVRSEPTTSSITVDHAFPMVYDHELQPSTSSSARNGNNGTESGFSSSNNLNDCFSFPDLVKIGYNHSKDNASLGSTGDKYIGTSPRTRIMNRRMSDHGWNGHADLTPLEEETLSSPKPLPPLRGKIFATRRGSDSSTAELPRLAGGGNLCVGINKYDRLRDMQFNTTSNIESTTGPVEVDASGGMVVQPEYDEHNGEVGTTAETIDSGRGDAGQSPSVVSSDYDQTTHTSLPLQERPRTGSHAFIPEFNRINGFQPSPRSEDEYFSPRTGILKASNVFGLPAALQVISIMDVRERSTKKKLNKSAADNQESYELERHFPDRKVNIFVGTWNWAGKLPNDAAVAEWVLPQTLDSLPDIYALGIQEGPNFFEWNEWEIMMQRVIGPSHVLYHSIWHGVQHLSIFVRRELVWFFSLPDHASHATRIASKFKTKGGVAIMFFLFGTSFLFVSSHLASDDGKIADRIQNYYEIVANLKFPAMPVPKNGDCTSIFDVVFFCGDLNFRLEPSIDRTVALEMVQNMTCLSEEQRNQKSDSEAKSSIKMLQMCHDELRNAMKRDQVFVDFIEPVIKFPPTYKFEFETSKYDSRRKPAYCDRILYKCKESAKSINTLAYESVHHVCCSDHKPVFAVFKVLLKPGKDKNMPSGGKFKRDVYMQGLSKNKKRSKICSMI